MTIKKALQRSYYLMALLPALFFIFCALTINFFVVHRALTTREERLENLSLVIPAVLIALITLISIIMVVNLAITRKQIKRITEPIALLEKNTKTMIDGDLQTPITYTESDEFTRVFEAFDEMRKQLLVSIDARTQLENNRAMFLRGITHDILTPLTAISGYIEALEDNIAKTPEQQAKYLAIIKQKAKVIEQLVDKLAVINQFQSTNNPFSLTQYSVDSFTKSITKIFERDYPNIQFSLQNNVPENATIRIDKTELIRVFINLIENSIKYAEVETLNITLTLEIVNNQYQFTFHNNGKEMNPQLLPYLFDPFFRGDAARTNTKNGSGLGLAICKQIISGHNGEISAKNNNGFEVIITIPNHQEVH